MKGNYYLLVITTSFMSWGCMSPVRVSPYNPLRILPGIKKRLADGTTPLIDTPDYSWMFQVTAIAVVLFAIASSWIAGRFTRSAKLLVIAGMGFSVWGLSMETIEETIAMYLPWVVGGFILWGVVDAGFRIYGKVGKKKKPTETDLGPPDGSDKL